MQELRGMPVVKQIAADAALQVEELKKKGIEPKLAVVRVGEREDDLSYERGLLKRFDAVGALVESVVFPLDVTQEELEAGIKKLNEDDKVHGILVFRPLPKHLNEEVIKEEKPQYETKQINMFEDKLLSKEALPMHKIIGQLFDM